MNKTMSKRYKITLEIFVFVTITAGLFGYLLDPTRGVVPTVLVFLIGLGLRKFRIKKNRPSDKYKNLQKIVGLEL